MFNESSSILQQETKIPILAYSVLIAGVFKREKSRPEVIKLLSYSTQLSTKFILLINVKMPTIVGILTFISMINIIHYLRDLKQETSSFVGILLFMSS